MITKTTIKSNYMAGKEYLRQYSRSQNWCKEVIEEDHKVCEAWEEFMKSKNMEVLACEKDDRRVAMRTGNKEIIAVRDQDSNIVYRRVKGKMEGEKEENSKKGRVRSVNTEARATGNLHHREGYARLGIGPN